MQETRVQLMGWEDQWQPTVPGKSHGQKNLVGCIVHGVARVRQDLTTKPKPSMTLFSGGFSLSRFPLACGSPSTPKLPIPEDILLSRYFPQSPRVESY